MYREYMFPNMGRIFSIISKHNTWDKHISDPQQSNGDKLGEHVGMGWSNEATLMYRFIHPAPPSCLECDRK